MHKDRYYCRKNIKFHYSDVIMSAIASQIISLTIIYSTVYSRRSSKKTSKLRVTGLCEGNSPVTGEFLSQRASNAENGSIWWRHHVVHQILGDVRVPGKHPNLLFGGRGHHRAGSARCGWQRLGAHAGPLLYHQRHTVSTLWRHQLKDMSRSRWRQQYNSFNAVLKKNALNTGYRLSFWET